MRRELIAKAEADAAEIRRGRRGHPARERPRDERPAVSVAQLSIELAEKIVERNLDRDTQIQLIESYINQVGSR